MRTGRSDSVLSGIFRHQELIATAWHHLPGRTRLLLLTTFLLLGSGLLLHFLVGTFVTVHRIGVAIVFLELGLVKLLVILALALVCSSLALAILLERLGVLVALPCGFNPFVRGLRGQTLDDWMLVVREGQPQYLSKNELCREEKS